MKKFSVRLPRTLQRGAPLVNAGLSDAIQTALDVATADRCDIVENFVVRPRKAWVRASCDCLSEQLHTLQSPSHADFPTVFLCGAAVFKLVVTSFGNGQRNVLAGTLSSCEDSEFSRKTAVELNLAACYSCSLCDKRKQSVGTSQAAISPF